MAKYTEIQFNKMSVKRRRMIIAQDVISNILSGRIEPTHGHYLVAPVSVNKNNYNTAEEYLAEIPVCQSCALGSMMVCTVFNFNKLKASDIALGGRRPPAYAILEAYFSEGQLAMVESAFETMPCNSPLEVLSKKVMLKCVAFGELYTDKKDRVIAIMSNILVNNGRFVP